MTSFGDNFRPSSASRGRASSSGKEERGSFKKSLDREYKLLTSNHSPFKTTTQDRARSSEKKETGLMRAALLQTYNQREREERESPNFDNNYYKQEIKNVRTSLKGIKGKPQKNGFTRSEIYTTKVDPTELPIPTHDEKDIVKKIQNEREQELHDEMNYKNSVYPNVGRNPTDRKEKRHTHLAYEERERDIQTRILADQQDNEFRPLNRSFGNSRGFNRTEADPKNSSLRDWNTFKDSILKKSPQAGDANDSQQNYFTNKDLVRAKYEQYEQGLKKKIQKTQDKREKHVEFDGEQSTPRDNPLREALDKRQEELREREEQRTRYVLEDAEIDKRKELEEDAQFEKLYRSDGFRGALEKKDRQLQQDYESIEKEKSWSNRGLVYRDEIGEDDYANARLTGFAAIYSQKKPIREKLMTAELQKLREENKRIQNEIDEINRRHNIESNYRSEKLTSQDWKNSFLYSGPLSASKMLSSTKKKRDSKSKKAHAVIAKEDDIQRTINNARKNIRDRLDANHEERGISQGRTKKILDLSIQDTFTGLRPKSCRNKFSAGTPQTHLLESSILLARGIPTSYMSDRGFDLLYKTPTSRGSKSRRR